MKDFVFQATGLRPYKDLVYLENTQATQIIEANPNLNKDDFE